MEITLSRNGFHKKLQHFVFKNPPHYNNLCPYFWLTVFCFIITFVIPIIPLIHLVRFIAVGCYKGLCLIFDFIGTYICNPFFDYLIEIMPEPDVVKTWSVYEDAYGEKYNANWSELADEEKNEYRFWINDYSDIWRYDYKERAKMIEKFKKWKEKNPNWEEKLNKIKENQKKEFEAYKLRMKKHREEEAKRAQEKYKKEQEKQAKKELTAEKRQQMFTNIVKYTKYPAIGILIALVLFVVYYILKFFYWVFTVFPWEKFAKGLLVVGKGVLIIAIIAFVSFAIGWLIIKLYKKCSISFSDIPFFTKTGKGIANMFNSLYPYLSAFGQFMDKLFEGIREMILMFIEFCKAWKKNNCPGIVWKD